MKSRISVKIKFDKKTPQQVEYEAYEYGKKVGWTRGIITTSGPTQKLNSQKEGQL